MPFDSILGSQFSGKSISASLINIDSETSSGNDDNDLYCEKKDNHVNQYQVSKTKTKVIAFAVDEKSHSKIEKCSVEGCPTPTTAAAATTAAVATDIAAGKTTGIASLSLILKQTLIHQIILIMSTTIGRHSFVFS